MIALPAIAVLLGLVPSDTPSLAEAARQEQRKRGATSAKAPVYTDEDLKRASGRVMEAPVTTDGAATGATMTAAPPPEDDAIAAGEAHWRARANGFRARVTAAEARVREAQSRLDGARKPQSVPNPIDALRPDPNHLVTSDEERRGLERALAEANTALSEARKLLSDFEDEARRKRVPPGWIRER